MASVCHYTGRFYFTKIMDWALSDPIGVRLMQCRGMMLRNSRCDVAWASCHSILQEETYLLLFQSRVANPATLNSYEPQHHHNKLHAENLSPQAAMLSRHEFANHCITVPRDGGSLRTSWRDGQSRVRNRPLKSKIRKRLTTQTRLSNPVLAPPPGFKQAPRWEYALMLHVHCVLILIAFLTRAF